MTTHERFMEMMGGAFDGLWRDRRLPASLLLGLRVVQMEEQRGDIAIEFEGKPEFCNAMGSIQGGFLAAMLDDAMGISGTVRSGMTRLMLTHELKISFIRPARPGRLIGYGHTLKLGRSIAYLEGSLTDASGALLARASATARPVSLNGPSRPSS